MKRRRLAALSEHMETRLVLSPLLGLSGRVAVNALRTAEAADDTSTESSTSSSEETSSSEKVTSLSRNDADRNVHVSSRDGSVVESEPDRGEMPDRETTSVAETTPVEGTTAERTVAETASSNSESQDTNPPARDNVTDVAAATSEVAPTPVDQVTGETNERQATLTTADDSADRPTLSTNGRAGDDSSARTQSDPVLPDSAARDSSPRDSGDGAETSDPAPQTHTPVTPAREQPAESLASDETITTADPVKENTQDRNAVERTKVEAETRPVNTDAVIETGEETEPGSAKTDRTVITESERRPAESTVSVDPEPTTTVAERNVDAIYPQRPSRSSVESEPVPDGADESSERTTERGAVTEDDGTASVADRDLTVEKTAADAQTVVDQIDPVTEVVPVFDEATGTVRLGIVAEVPSIGRREIVDESAMTSEKVQADAVQETPRNADTTVEVVDQLSGGEEPESVTDVALETRRNADVEPLDRTTVIIRDAADTEAVVRDTSESTDVEAGNSDRADGVAAENDRADNESQAEVPELRSAVAQPIATVRRSIDVIAANESVAETAIVARDTASTVDEAISAVEERALDDIARSDDAEIENDVVGEAGPESVNDESSESTTEETEPEASKEAAAPTASAVTSTESDSPEYERDRIMRSQDDHGTERSQVNAEQTRALSRSYLPHQSHQLGRAALVLAGVTTNSTMRHDEVAEKAASQTVFGDATRLGIMLAAIKTAGRRSGSQVLFSLADDDARSEGGSTVSDRRRRERSRPRRWEAFRHHKGRAELPVDIIDESSAIPCATTSVDHVFADSASMCILFQESAVDGEQVDTKTPLAGLMLGAAGVAVREATKQRGKKRQTRPDLPVPQYSGDTVVVSE